MAYNSASDEERLRMVEGLGKGAGLALLAVPMADAFIFSQAQFQRILSNYLGLEGAISIPHTHHCGGGAVRVLTTAAAVRCVCSRRGLSITCRCAQCSGGTLLHTMRSAIYFRTWWCKTASPMPQLWRHGLQQQTEEPTMLTWSTSIHPPGRGSSWRSQSSQSGPAPHSVGARELDWMGSMRS